MVKKSTFLVKRKNIKQIEEGSDFSPKFSKDGLIPVVTTDYKSNEVLMHGFMNKQALIATIKTGEATYWSRSRKTLWRKGQTSGFVQKIREMLIDDDQDAIWLRVDVRGGASCHVGYRSCFYRKIRISDVKKGSVKLKFKTKKKVFNPKKVYGDSPNPTKI